jgi:hypothetical protein
MRAAIRAASIAATALMLGVALGAGQTAQPDGRSVAEQIRDRDQGRDGRLEVRMRLFDRQGATRERRFTLTLLRGANREDRALVRFTKPNDIQGTGLLVWKHTKAESERFLYLPALGRVRRIAGGEAQESFVGSDFSYEDIGGQDIEAYSYELLGSDLSAPGPDGAPYKYFKLQAKARDPRAPFPTTISFVAKDSLIVMHAEFLDRAGQRRKTLDVGKLSRIQGIWTALEVTMATDRDRTRTELNIDSAQYNVGLSEEDLSRRELERGKT